MSLRNIIACLLVALAIGLLIWTFLPQPQVAVEAPAPPPTPITPTPPEPWLQFLYEYWRHIAGGFLLFLLVYVLGKDRIGLPSLRLPGRPWHKIPALPTEQRLVEAETRVERLQGNVEKLQLTLAKMKAEQIQGQIRREAKEKLMIQIPKDQLLLDPEKDIVGRPVFYFGGTPTISISEELDRLMETQRLPLPRDLLRKLLRWLYFEGSTLYWYDVRLLPNGKWAVVVTSKPAHQQRGFLRLKRFTRTYVLLTSMQDRIDDIILNRWEVTHAKAAVHLSATFLGPFPVEKWLPSQKNLWGGTR